MYSYVKSLSYKMIVQHAKIIQMWIDRVVPVQVQVPVLKVASNKRFGIYCRSVAKKSFRHVLAVTTHCNPLQVQIEYIRYISTPPWHFFGCPVKMSWINVHDVPVELVPVEIIISVCREAVQVQSTSTQYP